ncbi:hypothetical protein HQN90_05240 [Paenibacillus alba]|uniref:hypothetical protein n=1 Tax=Paenibacillus alba TaxID=1197127 RepID=UPI001567A57F|nr:hypothetical protein [Paenibacillus alba]NQX65527.1 hypothetical protein [Paenibacillus alba]
MKKTIIALISLALISGCSTLDQKYSSGIKEKVNSNTSISEGDKKLFESAVVNAEKTNATLEGQKVSEIILNERIRLDEIKKKEEDEKRKREEEEKKLREENERKEKEKAAKFNGISVSLVGKKLYPKDTDKWRFSDVLDFSFSITNNNDFDIKGIKGTTIYNDIFDANILKINLSYDQPIKAHETVDYGGSLELNQFMDEHNQLKNTELDKIKFQFDPKIIILGDGTKIEK